MTLSVLSHQAHNRPKYFKNNGYSADETIMRSPAISYGIIPLVAVCALLPGAERITVELQPGEGVTCGEVTTPRPWTVPPHNPAYLYPGLEGNTFQWSGAHVEIRQSSQLQISVFAPPGLYQGKSTTRLDSTDRYAIIRQNGKFTMIPVTEVEWQIGLVLPQSKAGVDGKAENGKPLPYSGRTFAPSGRYWWGSPFNSTLLSADKAHLALISWDGTVNLPEPVGAFQSTRMKGRYFLDLYHVPTGRRLALIRGSFRNVAPGFATDSFWIEGPRFILPVSSDMRRYVLCEVR